MMTAASRAGKEWPGSVPSRGLNYRNRFNCPPANRYHPSVRETY